MEKVVFVRIIIIIIIIINEREVTIGGDTMFLEFQTEVNR